jgi:glycosyltransferase involved in cell wall biosynthesis
MQSLRDAVLSQAGRLFPRRYLTVIGDGAGWALDREASEVGRIMRLSGCHVVEAARPWSHQVAFFTARDTALRGMDRWRRMRVPVCLSYYHGYPGTGEDSFDRTYELMRRQHEHVARVQVTHPRMRELLLEIGLAEHKIHTILIGIDATAFSIPTAGARAAIRRRLGIPLSAAVVGSFQKDGNGWGEGAEPKTIKAPDVLLDAIRLLKASVPALFVLLSGPARGFVRKGLESMGVPYVHAGIDGYADVPALYHALDAYIVPSRQEGGPKAILESMASGVPIISTRVGQAAGLIRHGETGWLVDSGDAEGLAHFTERSLAASGWIASYRAAARRTAEANDYLAQTPQWLAFFEGLVVRGTPS